MPWRGRPIKILCITAAWIGTTILLSQAPGVIVKAGTLTNPDLPDFIDKFTESDSYLVARNAYWSERFTPPVDAGNRRLAAIIHTKASLGEDQSVPVGGWTALGPAPIPNGQTETISTAVSGRVSAIAIHPTDPNVVYVGTANGGIYRSTNGGTSWTAIFDSADSLAIGALALAPTDSSILYVGTGESVGSCDAYRGVGLYRINSAQTTATLSGPHGASQFNNTAISKIVVNPSNADVVYVSNVTAIAGIGCTALAVPPPTTGVFRSTNASTATPTFTQITTGTGDVTDMVLDPLTANTLVVGVNNKSDATPLPGGIYRSANAQDAGPTFTQEVPLGDTVAGVRIELTASGSTIYAASGESNGRLRSSIDGGDTWPTTLAGANGFCGGQCFYDIGLAADPVTGTTVYIGGNVTGGSTKLFAKSTTAGISFTNSATGLHADMHAIAVAPSNGNVIYVGNDGGIYKSTDAGDNWTSLNNAGFSATQFQSIATHPTDRNFMIGGTQDNGTEMMTSTGTWTRADFGDGGFALIDQNATDTSNVTMYHTYFNQTNNLIGFGRVTNVANAVDNGWTFLGCSFPSSNNGINCADATLFYAPMALGPGNPNTVYFGTRFLYRSDDKGTTMTPVSQNFFTVTNGFASSIGISPQNDNVRIVGLRNGQVYATQTGANPMPQMTGFTPPANPGDPVRLFVSEALIDPTNINTAYVALSYYAAAGQGIFKTTNLNLLGSSTWSPASNGIPSIPINALVINPLDSNELFAGTDIGVYRSQDAGATWSSFNTGFPKTAVFDLAFQRGGAASPDQILRAATHGRGIYEISLSTGADLRVVKTGPSTVSADQNAVYTVQVFNDGPGSAPATVAGDNIPAGTTFVSNSGDCIVAYPCALGTIAPGASRTITTTINVSANYSGANPFNQVAFAVSEAADPNIANNTGSQSSSVCTPRPNVARTVTPAGPGELQVVVTAGVGNISSILFKGAPSAQVVGPNASVAITGAGSNLAQNVDFNYIPASPTNTVTFTLTRQGAGTTTLPFIVTDNCGPFPSFIGGGAGAF